jgi:hypothetical protein
VGNAQGSSVQAHLKWSDGHQHLHWPPVCPGRWAAAAPQAASNARHQSQAGQQGQLQRVVTALPPQRSGERRCRSRRRVQTAEGRGLVLSCPEER